MPELPEVETLKRELSLKIKNKKIKKVVVLNKKTVNLSIKKFTNSLVGKNIKKVNRRAKILIIELNDKNNLVFHLKMTGQLIFETKSGQQTIGGHPQKNGGLNLPNNYTRVYFEFADGSILYFNDMRKFGWVRILTTEQVKEIGEKHGVEPVDKKFSLTFFKSVLEKNSNKTVKQFLLEQKHIAGLGNIYVDESCFRAGVRPDKKVFQLTPTEINKLHKAIIKTIKLAIHHKGTSIRDYRTSSGDTGNFVKHLKVYGRHKERCLKCKSHFIEKIRHAGRGTHYCPNCQR